MSIAIDLDDPVGSLQRAGVDCTQCDTPSTTTFLVNGRRVGGADSVGMHYEWVLPESTPVHASFSRENLRHRLAGLFKRELRTGDKAFDKIVFVSTDDKDATSYLLSADVCRDAITNLIIDGGRVTIDRERLIFEVPGSATRRQLAAMARMAAEIMAH